ncbi:hypothetical protein PRIPAC_94628 [Pristionchus pacificus]|uniref:Uncharacterized protein n=1 Tax=Pristionchus pacificus TaxID=54126 RepID=A0A2A6BIG5_PRIPA|nr:hypothetical protein PRIPAC_94628 [Pristionchus pacificus]|eukprot:PDM65677.1 hypothetical protein PRIPAC_45591 [Pristionchus pacificus]
MLILTPNTLNALLWCTVGLLIFYFLAFAIGYVLRRSALKGHAKIEPSMRDIIRRKERADGATLAKQKRDREREKEKETKKAEKKPDPQRSDPPLAPKKPPKEEEPGKAAKAASANTISRDSAEPTRRFPRKPDPVFVVNYNTEGALLKGAPSLAKTDDGKLRERQRKWKTDNEFLAAVRMRGDLAQCEKKPVVLECK